MIARVLVLTVLMVLALAAPWMVEGSFADTIPNYFQDERPGFACVNATTGGSTTTLLLQLNFDNFAGSIPLARADSLFARFTTSLGWLSQLLGASLQVTCTLSPSQTQEAVPGLTALQAAQQLSGTFQQRGFASYLVLDTFLSVAPSYIGSNIPIARTDAFRVVGANNLSYVGSNDIIDSLLP